MLSADKKTAERQLEQMPNFGVSRLNDVPFTKDSLANKAFTLFLYFHADCDFCRHEIESIAENSANFKRAQLLFVSPDELVDLKKIVSERQLGDDSTFVILRDERLEFASQFHIKSSPCTLLYDGNRKLVKRIDGQVLAGTILKEMEYYENR
jgi:peroxiredoxin